MGGGDSVVEADWNGYRFKALTGSKGTLPKGYDLFRDFQFPELGATGEGILAYTGDCWSHPDPGQFAAVSKNMVPNRGYRVWDLEGFQPGAFPEGPAANGRELGWELQFLKSAASPEGLAANGGQARRKLEGFEGGALLEGAAANGSYSFAEYNLGDPGGFQGLIVDPVRVAAVDTGDLDGDLS